MQLSKFIAICFLASPSPSFSGFVFQSVFFSFYVSQNLPRDAIYLPAITIQLQTSRGHSPIGICVVENLHKYEKHKDDHHSLLDKSKILFGF